jgi:hypothetical protein
VLTVEGFYNMQVNAIQDRRTTSNVHGQYENCFVRDEDQVL